MRAPVRLGLQIPNFTYPGVPDAGLFERASEIAVTAERSGFDSVWVMDHVFIERPKGRVLAHEPMMCLAHVAMATSRIRASTLRSSSVQPCQR